MNVVWPTVCSWYRITPTLVLSPACLVPSWIPGFLHWLCGAQDCTPWPATLVLRELGFMKGFSAHFGTREPPRPLLHFALGPLLFPSSIHHKELFEEGCTCEISRDSEVRLVYSTVSRLAPQLLSRCIVEQWAPHAVHWEASTGMRKILLSFCLPSSGHLSTGVHMFEFAKLISELHCADLFMLVFFFFR